MDEPSRNPPGEAGDAGSSPESLSPEPAPTPALQWVFLGPHGLRAGWRLLIYLAAFLVLVVLFVHLSQPLSRHRAPLWGLLITEVEELIAAVIPALVLARYEGRRFGAYGLPLRQGFGRQFWLGVVWGICAMSALLLAMHGFGVFDFGGLALHGVRIWKFAAFWGALFLTVGLFEEFFNRGYTLFTLTEGMRFWPAAVVLSCAFGAVHLGNPGEAWVGALGAASIGLFWCLTLRRTGTLWFAVGMHAAWDWSETFLYSVPDSGLVAPGHLLHSSFHGPGWLTGGSVGPEGSVFVFVLLALLWLLFDRLYRGPEKRNQQDSDRASLAGAR
jgi:uncharacterized protein